MERSRRRIAGLAAVLVAGLAAGPASGAGSTLYVDRSNPSCTNSGTGTQAQPFCTISAAAARVGAGQTVQVAAGTYPETVTVPVSGTSTAPVAFTAAPGATVTLSGGANGFVLSGRSWVTIDGFSVTGTTGWAIDVSSSSHITISDNHVTLAGRPVSGKVKGGIRFTTVTDSTIDGNTADHNSDYGILLTTSSTRNVVSDNTAFNNAEGFQRAAAGIRQYRSPGNTIARNVSHDNEDSGIESYTGSNNSLIYDNVTYHNGDHGIDNYQSTGQRIFANTVYDNVTAGINVEGSSTGATLANNIAVDNGINSPRTHSNIRIESGSTSGTTMDYDLVHLTSSDDALLIWSSKSYMTLSAFRSASHQETHGIDAAPGWAGPSSGDFHLSAGSPAIDSADSSPSGQPTTDIEGNGRVDDPAVPDTGAGTPAYADRGAYERQAGGDAPPTARLSVTPSSAPVNAQVTADASASTDPDATPIASYDFDFGDGTPATGPQTQGAASHAYNTPGTYTVTVTVTDTAGLTDRATDTVTVTTDQDAPPSAALTVGPSSGTPPLAVIADASGSSDGDATPIATYDFDFGDGTAGTGPQTGASASHTYAAAGTFTVTVTVTDTAGLADRATGQVTVSASAQNLIGNPGFETSLSGWDASSASDPAITLTRVAGGHSGDWSARAANTGTSNLTCMLNDSPNWIRTTSAGAYTGSLWVRTDAPGATLKLRFREYSSSGALLGTQTTLATLTTSWSQVSVTYSPAAPGSSTLDFNAYVSNASPGTCFYADDASIVRS
jgi:parallel beta-helix repeat protein